MAQNPPNKEEHLQERNTDNCVTVGQIRYNPDDVIGRGSQGTVYKGRFGRRTNVAVKRIEQRNFIFAEKEVKHLIRLDSHPNVVRYFHMEKDRDFCYIALELCQGSLYDYVTKKYTGPETDRVILLEQGLRGLVHLHHLGIVHQDIKPQNILLAVVPPGMTVAKITDFGTSKMLSPGHESYTATSWGTMSWAAPETFDGEGRPTNAVDVFSLGCLFFYVLSGGHHPFGELPKIPMMNIQNGKYSLSAVSDITCTSVIEQMIDRDPKKRPSASDVLGHPLFWTPKRRMDFFQVVSDRVKGDKTCPLAGHLADRAWEVIGGTVDSPGSWKDKIDTSIDKGRFKSYDGSTIPELLRVIRNKMHHILDDSEDAQQTLGLTPHDHASYWTEKFPRLLVHVWQAVSKHREEQIFKEYYAGDVEPRPRNAGYV